MTDQYEFPRREKCHTRGCENVIFRASKKAIRFCQECRDAYGREQSAMLRSFRRERSLDDERPLRREYVRRLTDGWAMMEGEMPQIDGDQEL